MPLRSGSALMVQTVQFASGPQYRQAGPESFRVAVSLHVIGPVGPVLAAELPVGAEAAPVQLGALAAGASVLRVDRYGRIAWDGGATVDVGFVGGTGDELVDGHDLTFAGEAGIVAGDADAGVELGKVQVAAKTVEATVTAAAPTAGDAVLVAYLEVP